MDECPRVSEQNSFVRTVTVLVIQPEYRDPKNARVKRPLHTLRDTLNAHTSNHWVAEQARSIGR